MRITQHLKFWLCAVLLVGPVGTVSAKANEQVIDCPTEVPAQSIKLVDIPSGFTGHIPGPIFLTGAGLMYGPPARLATSVPPISKITRGKEVARWNDLADVEDKWMACYYGGQEVILSRPIDSRAHSCSVVSTVDRHRPVIDVRCTW